MQVGRNVAWIATRLFHHDGNAISGVSGLIILGLEILVTTASVTKG